MIDIEAENRVCKVCGYSGDLRCKHMMTESEYVQWTSFGELPDDVRTQEWLAAEYERTST